MKMDEQVKKPGYEKPEDVAAERAFADEIESMIENKLLKLPVKYGADFIVFVKEGEPGMLIETKIRNINHDRFRDYGISLAKCVTALTYADAVGVPFFLWVKFADGKIGRKRINGETLQMVIMAGSYRNDGDVAEPCVSFPTNDFEWMN